MFRLAGESDLSRPLFVDVLRKVMPDHELGSKLVMMNISRLILVEISAERLSHTSFEKRKA